MLPPLSRRQFLLSSAVAGLSACSAETSVYGAMWPTLKRVALGAPNVPIDRENIQNTPLASISARIGRNDRGMMVLLRSRGETHYWFAKNRLILVTRYGRIVQTAGLPNNLRAVRSRGEDPLQTGAHLLSSSAKTTYTYDVELEEGYSTVYVDAVLDPIKDIEITISGLQFKTRYLRERCRARGTKWTFENRYWVDVYDGLVWRSRQNVSPEMPSFDLETLKPVA